MLDFVQDNLFLWDVELSDFEKGSLLQKDLENYAQKYSKKVGRNLRFVYPQLFPHLF